MQIRRSHLLVLLAVQLLAWGFLIARTPVITGDSFWLNNAKTTAYVHETNGPAYDRQGRRNLAIDLLIPRVRELSEGEFLAERRLPSDDRAIRSLMILRRPYESPNNLAECELREFDRKTGSLLKSTRIEFPVTPNLINRRFLVGMSSDAFFSMDTDHIKAGIKRTPAPIDDPGISIYSPHNAPWFYRIAPDLPTGVVVNPKGSANKIELYRITENGKVESTGEWPLSALTRNPHSSASIVGDDIVSIGADLQSIVFRSSTDGSIKERMPLPGNFDLLAIDWRLAGKYFMINTNEGWTFYDLQDRLWLPKPEGKWSMYGRLDEEGLFLFSSELPREQVKVMDPTNGDAYPPIEVPLHHWTQFYDSTTIANRSDTYGLSIRLVDFRTGRLRTWIRPLWWVPGLLGLLFVAFAGWSLAWFVVSARDGGWPWMDSLIVSGPLLGALALRIRLFGNSFDMFRTPYQYGMGIAIAVLVLSGIWLAFGSTRISLRYLPILFLFPALIVVLLPLFEQDSRGASFLLGAAARAASITTMGMIIASWWGVRLRLNAKPGCQSGGDSQVIPPHMKQTHMTRPRLKDYFILTVAVAFIAVVSRPLLPTIGTWFTAYHINYYSILDVPIAIVPFLVVFTPRKKLFSFGCLLAALTLVVLAAEPIISFTTGDFISKSLLYAFPVRTALTAMVAVFVLCLPFRLRGWELTGRVSA